MASNDLARLYSTKKTIENYYGVENGNAGCTNRADSECAAVTNDEKAKLEKLDERILSVGNSSFFIKTIIS